MAQITESGGVEVVFRRPAWARSAAAVAVMTTAVGCSGRGATSIQGAGPLEVGPPMASSQVAATGTEIGWGMLLVQAPEGWTLTLLSARAVTTNPAAALGDGYAAGWPRTSGQIQWTSWPPKADEIGADAVALPELTVDVAGAGEGPGTEVFVGLKVPEGGLEMHGIELTYTDGQTTWTQVVPHAVRVCTSGPVADCALPQIQSS